MHNELFAADGFPRGPSFHFAEYGRLSLADQACFADAFLNPPKPAPALKRAFARRRKLLRAE